MTGSAEGVPGPSVCPPPCLATWSGGQASRLTAALLTDRNLSGAARERAQQFRVAAEAGADGLGAALWFVRQPHPPTNASQRTRQRAPCSSSNRSPGKGAESRRLVSLLTPPKHKPRAAPDQPITGPGINTLLTRGKARDCAASCTEGRHSSAQQQSARTWGSRFR